MNWRDITKEKPPYDQTVMFYGKHGSSAGRFRTGKRVGTIDTKTDTRDVYADSADTVMNEFFAHRIDAWCPYDEFWESIEVPDFVNKHYAKETIKDTQNEQRKWAYQKRSRNSKKKSGTP